jgi:hypothetical protein
MPDQLTASEYGEPYDMTMAVSMLVPRELILRNGSPTWNYTPSKPDSECTPEELAERMEWRARYAREEADRAHCEALIENVIRTQFGAEGYEFFRDQNYGDY